jgi:hypothetical protein
MSSSDHGGQTHTSLRRLESPNSLSSQVQHAVATIDLSTLHETPGTRATKDYFLLNVRDSSFQRMLISARENTPQSGTLFFQMVQVNRGRVTALSEQFQLRTIPSQPLEFTANRAWTGGSVYLRVNALSQDATMNVTIEHLASEIP